MKTVDGDCTFFLFFLTTCSHIESPTTCFGSALNYVAARLIGADKEDPRMVKGRKWIHQQGKLSSALIHLQL